MLIRLVAILVFAVCGSAWTIDAWLRPAMVCRLPDSLWWWGAFAAGFVFVALARPGRGGWPCGRSLGIALVAIIAALGASRWVGGRISLFTLCHDQMIAAEPFAVGEFLEKQLHRKGHSLSSGRSWFGQNDRPALRHLVECSRWPVRRAFLRRMMVQPAPADVLAEEWHDYFPAVIGSDVDLRHRRKMIRDLERIRTKSNLSMESRRAAILWMGLVYLTDPPEFDAWRTTIRDALIACPEPVLADSGDYWMRILDVVLAFDAPDRWGEITAPLAADPMKLRRAVRERVRGMTIHVEEFIAQAGASETAGDWNGAFAAWLDLGRLLVARPDPAVAERVESWRRDTMFRWLTTEGLGGFGSILSYRDGLLSDLPEDAIVRMTSDQEETLATRAHAAARLAVEAGRLAADDEAQRADVHRHVERARVLDPFLTDAHQAELARRIGPVLVRLPLFMVQHRAPKGKHRYTVSVRYSRFLKKLWPKLSDESRRDYGPAFRTLWERMQPTATLLALDAWSGASGLSGEEWLLTALAVSWSAPTFSKGDPDHPPDVFDFPLPVPLPGEAVVDAVAQRLARARASTAVRAGVAEGFWEKLRACEGRPDLPEWMLRGMVRIERDGKMGSDQTVAALASRESLLEFELSLVGLRERDEQFQSLVERIMLENLGRFSLLWLRPNEPNPWRDVLASPARARAVALDYLDHPSQRFQSLLTAVVREPPPDDVVTAMWEALREESWHGPKERRLEAFGALLRLSPLVDRERRLVVREEFRAFYASTPVPLGNWPTHSMSPVDVDRSIWPGEGIPWEDDRLSAMLSWSSDIKRETYRFPSRGVPETYTGVFSYVAQAFVSYEEAGLAPLFLMPVPPTEPAPADCWKRQPLDLPLESTPWQRARALHLRRPDLPFPDRGSYRPGERW